MGSGNTKNKKLIKLPVKNYMQSLKNYMMSINDLENFKKYKTFDYRIKKQLILN